MQMRVEENVDDIGKCGCGRSPTGKCVGFHSLSEQAWAEQKTQLIHNLESKFGKVGIEKPVGEPDDEAV